MGILNKPTERGCLAYAHTSRVATVVHSRFSGTRVSRARVAMHTRYPARIGDRTIVREVLNVLVRCMMRMGDVAK